MLTDADGLYRVWHVDGESVPHDHEVYDDESRLKREKKLMARIRAGIDVRKLPAVCVRFGSCSFAHQVPILAPCGSLGTLHR